MLLRKKSLLPKKLNDRDALILKFPNIKPRLILNIAKDLYRLKNIISRASFIGILILYFLGYYPTFSFPPIQKSQVLASEEQKYELAAASFTHPISLPHPGYLSTKFSRFHPGIDIATGLGMPVHPISTGVIEEVNFGFWGYGNHIIVTHPEGFKSLYAHLGKIYAKKGQEVTPLSFLGEVGMTGQTSGPHTHLEIISNDRYIDPVTILPEIRDYPESDFNKSTGGSSKIDAAAKKTELHKTLQPDL